MNYTEAVYLALAVAFVVLSIVILIFYYKESLATPVVEKPKDTTAEDSPIREKPVQPINVALDLVEEEKKKKKDYSAGDRDGLLPYEASLVQSAMGLSSDVMRVKNKPGSFIWQD